MPKEPLPADSPPPSGAKPGDDGYDPAWMSKLSQKQRDDLREFFKADPIHKEYESAKNELARRQKWGALDRSEIEQMLDAEKQLEDVKALAQSLGVATKEELDDARTTREVHLMLRGRKATQTARGGAENEPDAFLARMDAWAKERGIAISAPASPKTEAIAKGDPRGRPADLTIESLADKDVWTPDDVKAASRIAASMGVR